MKEIQKVVQKLSCVVAYEPVQKHKVTPGISGWLNEGLLSTGPLGTKFSEILIEIETFSMKIFLFKSVVCQIGGHLVPASMC